MSSKLKRRQREEVDEKAAYEASVQEHTALVAHVKAKGAVLTCLFPGCDDSIYVGDETQPENTLMPKEKDTQPPGFRTPAEVILHYVLKHDVTPEQAYADVYGTIAENQSEALVRHHVRTDFGKLPLSTSLSEVSMEDINQPEAW